MMQQRNIRLQILLITLLLLALNGAGAIARADGDGTPRLVDKSLGPYQLSVWTEPEPPQVGTLRITAALVQANTGETVSAPAIQVFARAPHTDVLEATMGHGDASQPDLYDAVFEIPYAAQWTIELAVDDGEWQGSVSFPLDIEPAPINNNLIRLAAFLTLVVLGIGWWFWGRHPRKKRTRKRIFMPRPDED